MTIDEKIDALEVGGMTSEKAAKIRAEFELQPGSLGLDFESLSVVGTKYEVIATKTIRYRFTLDTSTGGDLQREEL